jgi:hypothetical protein
VEFGTGLPLIAQLLTIYRIWRRVIALITKVFNTVLHLKTDHYARKIFGHYYIPEKLNVCKAISYGGIE